MATLEGLISSTTLRGMRHAEEQLRLTQNLQLSAHQYGAMNRILQASMSIEQSLHRMLERQRAMERTLQPLSSMEHGLQRNLEQYRALERSMQRFREIVDPPALRAIRDFGHFQQTLDNQLASSRAFARLSSSVLPPPHLQAYLEAVNALRPTWNVLSATSGTIADFVRLLDTEQSVPEDLDELTVEEVSEITELTEPLNEAIESVQSAQLTQLATINQTIENGFARLLDHLRSDSISVQRKMFVLQLLIGLVILFSDKAIDRILPPIHLPAQMARPVEVVRKAQSIVVNIQINPMLHHHRVVCVREVRVHSRAKSGSHCVGKLFLGKIVRSVDKRKGWVRIEWSSDLNVRSGWVRSKYLCPLVRR